MRTLAKKIGIPSGRLSEILNGKRKLSNYYLEKIFVALNMTESEVARIRRIHYNELYKNESAKTVLLDHDQISKLISWKLYAIWSFLETVPYQKIAESKASKHQQKEKMSQYLEIPVNVIEDLIRLMEKSRLIEWEALTNRYNCLIVSTTTGPENPEEAIKAYHRDTLDLAKEKIDAVDIKNRDFSGMTLTLNPEDLPKAKKMLRDFRNSFTKKLESGEKKSVYHLGIQFFPLTKVDRNNL